MAGIQRTREQLKLTYPSPTQLDLSLREAVGQPSIQFAVTEAWLTMPDWITRRTEMIELVNAHTATHRIILDISLPDSLREMLTVTPRESETARWQVVDDKNAQNGDDSRAEAGAPKPNGQDERTESSKTGNEGRAAADQVVLLPVAFFRRKLPLPQLEVTAGREETMVGLLPKELNDRMTHGIIALANSGSIQGSYTGAPQRFECPSPERAWMCERTTCPGRTEAALAFGDLKTCPPPGTSRTRYLWPYCARKDQDGCICVRERCPATSKLPVDIGLSSNRSLPAFLESCLATDYGVIVLAPAGTVTGTFRVEISFTRELTAWEDPNQASIDATRGRLARTARRSRRLWDTSDKAPIARCGPFQGVIDRSRARPLWLTRLTGGWRRGAGKGLGEAARQTDAIRSGWREADGLFRRRPTLRRFVARSGAHMTVGVQTSSIGDAGAYHFVFGAPSGMQIAPSGGWLHDFPHWHRSYQREGLPLPQAPDIEDSGNSSGYADDHLATSASTTEKREKLVAGRARLKPLSRANQHSPAPYVAFVPADGLDEKVSISPETRDLAPTASRDFASKDPNFSRGATLFALIQFRPATRLPAIATISGLLLTLLLLAIFAFKDSLIGREDAWVALFILVPGLLAGVSAAREHPVTARLLRGYQLLLALISILSVGAILVLLLGTNAPTSQSDGKPPPISETTADDLDLGSPLNPIGQEFPELLLPIILIGTIIITLLSIIQLLISRAANKWANLGSPNQLDLVAPSMGFKLDSLKRPWSDPSPLRPKKALDDLEDLKRSFSGPPGGELAGSRGGVDTLVHSSQDLAAGLRSPKARAASEAESRLREKYGVSLPAYTEVTDESRFVDGFIFENYLNSVIQAAVGPEDYVDLSPRYLAAVPGRRPEDLVGKVPGASDDDLDRFIMTLMAMSEGTGVISQGCLLGEYTPASSAYPLRRWKAFPDLLIHRDLLGGTELLADGSAGVTYFPVDIKQGGLLSHSEEDKKRIYAPNTEPVAAPEGSLFACINNNPSPEHYVSLYAYSAIRKNEVTEGRGRIKHSYYLAQLGLYSVLLQQAEEILHLLKDKNPEVLDLTDRRAAVTRTRSLLTSPDLGEQLLSSVTRSRRPRPGGLWGIRGNGDASRVFQIPEAMMEQYLAEGIDLVMTAQVGLTESLLN